MTVWCDVLLLTTPRRWAAWCTGPDLRLESPGRHYKAVIHSHLEYAVSVCNPHRQSFIKKWEKVQKHVTKVVIISVKKIYEERLWRLKLPTLKCRRTRGDTIELYKISAKLLKILHLFLLISVFCLSSLHLLSKTHLKQSFCYTFLLTHNRLMRCSTSVVNPIGVVALLLTSLLHHC